MTSTFEWNLWEGKITDKFVILSAKKHYYDGLNEICLRICIRNGLWTISKKKDGVVYFQKLARDLAQEQGWAPVTISNMSADDYNELKSATHSAAMLPQQASDWISQCFGFNVHRIKILTEIPAYEKDRHGCLRKCGTEDREPFYYSTDWNYIAFTAAGLSYEIVNGDLYFYDGEF